MKKSAVIIMKRELKAYFTAPVAYIVTALFLIISGILLDIILGKSFRENLLHNLVNFVNEISFCYAWNAVEKCSRILE